MNDTKWQRFRFELHEAELGANDPWFDEDEILAAIHESARKGVDAKLIITCRHAHEEAYHPCGRESEYCWKTVKPNLPRILAIDDDADYLELLQMLLNRLGYRVETETCPELAIDHVENFEPDLVILDLVMPGHDGYEVAARIRSVASLRNVPIIMVTALVSRNESGGLINRGLLHLAKPVETRAMKHCVEELLSSKQ